MVDRLMRIGLGRIAKDRRWRVVLGIGDFFLRWVAVGCLTRTGRLYLWRVNLLVGVVLGSHSVRKDVLVYLFLMLRGSRDSSRAIWRRTDVIYR